jgi:hypothetical protein
MNGTVSRNIGSVASARKFQEFGRQRERRAHRVNRARDRISKPFDLRDAEIGSGYSRSWEARGHEEPFDAMVANQVKTRLERLGPQSERHWGKMTAAQMLAHCSVSMQWAVGEVGPDKGALPARLMGRLVKPMVFRNGSHSFSSA